MKNNGLPKIEHDIEIPPARGGRMNGYGSLVRELKKGDSVLLPVDGTKARNVAQSALGAGNYTCRKVDTIDPVQVAIDVTREVAELPDRTSPEDQPEIMLVKDSELRRIVHNVLVEALHGQR